MSAARKFAKDNGMTVEQVVLNMIADKSIQDAVRVAAAKLYNEALIAKVTEKNVEITEHKAPAIGLPAVKEDPAFKILSGGKQ